MTNDLNSLIADKKKVDEEIEDRIKYLKGLLEKICN